MHNGLLAHARAVEAFRAQGDPGAEIGIVVDVWKRHPATDAPADRELAERQEDESFRFFLEPILTGGYGRRITDRLEARGVLPEIAPGDLASIAQPIDYLGLNVYSRVVVSAEHDNPRWWVASEAHPGGNFLDNGMEFYPRAVYDAIQMVTADYGYRGPIIIAENGMADAPDMADPLHDHERIRYVAGFLEWIARAIDEGADVRAYYLWSLLDNYEWAAGFSQRFGIVRVDPDTLERVPKVSAGWYREVIAQRGFDSIAP
jgi:beta-glucosidase